ncbi:hypothetical protein HIM_00898 [Hirsutella minnesotensis 3608]|nr:hypothetical protein HIM_00898 [Hirsutella minnesotensis 3608]
MPWDANHFVSCTIYACRRDWTGDFNGWVHQHVTLKRPVSVSNPRLWYLATKSQPTFRDAVDGCTHQGPHVRIDTGDITASEFQMPVDDVPDSTDWLATPLSGLAAVEAALRCQVCKDFFNTPMITSCSHTFCSLCIRRALSNEGKCPLCRAPEQELKLRSNWAVEDAVEAFSKARSGALTLARESLTKSPSVKRKADVVESPDTQPKRLRTSARLSKARGDAPSPSTEPEVQEHVIEDSDDDEYVPDDPDGFVPCPVCQRKMKAWQVFQHLEACPGPSGPEESRNGNTAPASTPSRQRQDRSHERLPALNYSMLKEQALRKKLSEIGISNQGPRSLLERRHREWLTLWNANCDAAQPKKRSQLLHDLEVWERTQGGRASAPGRAFQNSVAIKDKDFDSAAWANKHESSFKDLIATAMRSKSQSQSNPQSASEKSSADASASNAEGGEAEIPEQSAHDVDLETSSRPHGPQPSKPGSEGGETEGLSSSLAQATSELQPELPEDQPGDP